MKLFKYYNNLKDKSIHLSHLVLLLIRLTLAYGFYNPAISKLKDINGIGQWFESMNYPLPYLNAYLATGTEILGVLLLVLGLGTRFISIPLIIVMVVAATTLHWGNGFNASDNGFEIPLYYMLMLLTLVVYGAGKFSIDKLIRKRFPNNK